MNMTVPRILLSCFSGHKGFHTTGVAEASSLEWLAGCWPDEIEIVHSNQIFLYRLVAKVSGKDGLLYTLYQTNAKEGVPETLKVFND